MPQTGGEEIGVVVAEPCRDLRGVKPMSLPRSVKLTVLLCAAWFVMSQFAYAQCQLEDLSPGPGTTVDKGQSRSGKMLAISATGLEGAIGPPTTWSSSNQGVIVDHVAAADKDGELVLFYSYRGSDWKAVSVTEKTNATIAVVRPESWVFPDGPDILERIAAPSPSGDLLLFTWHSGSDWVVTNLSNVTKKKIAGPVTSWQVPSGDKMVEHIAARGIDNHFLVFWRIAGGEWGLVDVTDITGQQVGDSGTSWAQNIGAEWLESVAMPTPAGDLILFRFRPSTDWQAQNISQLTAAKQKIGGAPVHWIAPGGPLTDYLAAPAPNGDLVIFSQDPIDRAWSVLNLTSITGQRVAGSVTNWNMKGGGSWWEHLAGRGSNDHLYIFSREAGGTWQVGDVTNLANQNITQPPASWVSTWDSDTRENVVATSWDGHLYVFTYRASTGGWTTADASLTAYGRIVYASGEFAGIWRSRDYGTTWEQMARPQPAYGDQTVGGLNVPYVLDVIASPVDPNLVLAATDRDHRDPSLAGIYRSKDGGSTWKLVHQFRCDGEIQPATQIIFAPGDPNTLYAVGGCSIAVSHTRGEKWEAFAVPETSSKAGVWHVAMSEELPGEVRHGYACGDGRMWYSRDNGKPMKWYLDKTASDNLPNPVCTITGSGMYPRGDAPGVLAIEPGRPDHVFLAVQNRSNGRSYFHPDDGGPQGVYSNIPVVYDSNGNNIYDGAEQVIWPGDKVPPPLPAGGSLKSDPKLKFVDANSNGQLDSGEQVVYDVNGNNKYDYWNSDLKEPALRGDPPEIGTSLSSDLKVKYVDVGGPFGPRGAGEGSIWYGDYSTVDPAHPSGKWSQLPGPPIYFGGSTTSGRVYVVTKPTPGGYLLFFSNRESVHVSFGKPTDKGWHRMDALDASASRRANNMSNTLLVHVDPHALTVSPDFDLSLRSVVDQPFPYNQNMELDKPAPSTTAYVPSKDTCDGRIWIANDGGIYRSDDCGQHWEPSLAGLNTLASHNIAVAAHLTQKQQPIKPPVMPPALYFGTTDNDDFFSPDGGKTWRSAQGKCGDCDVWYVDPAQPGRVWRHPPRDSGKHAFVVFVTDSGVPDPSSDTVTVDYPTLPDGTQWKIPSGAGEGGNDGYRMGSRPIIQTLANEAPLPNGDYVVLGEAGSRRVLLRAKNTAGRDSPLVQEGPDLPSSSFLVQASGGHTATVFYVGDGVSLWRWPRNDKSKLNEWQLIVPGGGATRASRFFVNPYASDVLYILDQDTVRHSATGGKFWAADLNLDSALTENQAFQRTCDGSSFCVMNDMVFSREFPDVRFAVGIAGVFHSGNHGLQWRSLLDTRSLPSRPRAAFFDSVTDSGDLSLYIAFEGRGIMRCHPIPLKFP